jgi:hypothetical protein
VRLNVGAQAGFCSCKTYTPAIHGGRDYDPKGEAQPRNPTWPATSSINPDLSVRVFLHLERNSNLRLQAGLARRRAQRG